MKIKLVYLIERGSAYKGRQKRYTDSSESEAETNDDIVTLSEARSIARMQTPGFVTSKNPGM